MGYAVQKRAQCGAHAAQKRAKCEVLKEAKEKKGVVAPFQERLENEREL